jgi:hypothetical protein
MIIQLRRRHYHIWLILAFLLPILAFLAYFNIPENGLNNFKRAEVDAYPNVLKSKNTKNLEVKIRSNSKQELQLELVILYPIEGAANQIFISNSMQNEKKVLLGSIESTGSYLFPLPDSFSESTIFLTVFDVLKNKEIIKLKIE